jgi:hypothetical protein
MPDTSADAPRTTPSRRTVLKTGAHAAWAVPAIQIAAATPAFAASGTPVTYPTSKLTVSVVGYNRTSGYVVVEVAATVAAAKNVVVTVSGYNNNGSSATSNPVSVPLGGKAQVTIAVAFSNGRRTLSVVANGTTDNPGAAAAVASTSSTVQNNSSGTQAAVLTLTSASSNGGYTFDWNTFSWKYFTTVSFRINTTLAAKDVAWTVTTSSGALLAGGTTGTINANTYKTASTSITVAKGTVLTLKATGNTSTTSATPAVTGVTTLTA